MVLKKQRYKTPCPKNQSLPNVERESNPHPQTFNLYLFYI